MERFGSFLKRKEQRREALHEAFRIIDRNQAALGEQGTEVLRKHIIAAWAAGEINDVIDRRMGELIMSSLFGNSQRLRR